MTKRPMINTYELDENGIERLVYREMTAAEWKEHQKEAKQREQAQAARPHPLIEQIQAMSEEDRALLKELLA